MRKQLLGLAVVGSMAFAGGTVNAAVNLLVDPGFEPGTGGNLVVAGANADAAGATGWVNYAGTAYTNTSLPHSGSQDLKSYGQYLGAYQQFTVVPGQTYTATVYAVDTDGGTGGAGDILAAGVSDVLGLNFYTADQAANYMLPNAALNGVNVLTGVDATHATDMNGNTVALNTYVLGTITATVPLGTDASGGTPEAYTVGRVQLDNSNWGGAAYWDDATLVLVPTPEPTSLGLLALASVGVLRRRRA